MDPGSSAKGREAGLAPDPPLCLPTHQVMLPVFIGELVSPETLGTTLAELDVTLQVLEDKFLQSKAFLAGPHISLADLVAITELMHVSAMGGGGGEGAVGQGALGGCASPAHTASPGHTTVLMCRHLL